MSARDAVLAALRRGGFPVPLPPPMRTPPRVERTALFMQRAADAGAEVRLTRPSELAQDVVRAVIAQGKEKVVIWDDPLLAGSVEALRGVGLTIVEPKGQMGETASDEGVGLTSVDRAIAETGTLVLACAPGRPRAVSLLPPRHIAVLPEARIYGDLFELIGALGRPLPSALTFITGPSRTADIGLTLVRGAHGPMALTVFVVSS
ncbi:MAG TPA: LUD domain-containing protein [bacterium]